MKIKLLSFAFGLCLSVLFPFNSMMAQCTPDPTPTYPGGYPSVLETACEQAPYQDVLTVVFPIDSVIAGATYQFDSVAILNITNLPNGLSYTCGTVNCRTMVIPPNFPRICAEITGTPTAAAATDTVQIELQLFFTSFGNPQIVYTTYRVILPYSVPTTSTLTETACDSFSLNGQTYSSSGVYTQTITNTGGCDSTITLNLSINPVNDSVSSVGGTLTANAGGATYQWVNCDNGFAAIPGETGQSFTPATSGNFAVIVTENGCTDTSACNSISVSVTKPMFPGGHIDLFPNPSPGNFTLVTEKALNQAEIKIFTTSGQLVLSQSGMKGQQFRLNGSHLQDGIYVVEISQGTETAHIKWVKN